MMYQLKGYVFVHQEDKIIPVSFENPVEGYEEAHELFKRSNLPYYMFLLKEVRE